MFVIDWLSAMSRPILRYRMALAFVPVGTNERIEEAVLFALSITPCPSVEIALHPAPLMATVSDTHGDVKAPSMIFIYILMFAESVDGVNVRPVLVNAHVITSYVPDPLRLVYRMVTYLNPLDAMPE